MSHKILVVGATGNVGGEVVRLLSARGEHVRAMVRNRANAAAIALPNVETVEGDLEKPATLGAALAGMDRVFLVSSPDPRQAELQGNLIDAAKRAGGLHVVKLSTIGATLDSPVTFFRWHAATEQYLAGSGLPFTILQPNFFMQNMLASAGSIAAEGKFYGSVKEGESSAVDTRDVAVVAAHILTGSGHEGKTYIITGPEALSFADIAKKLSSVLGKAVSYIDIPPDALIGALTGFGMPDWQARGIVELYDWLGQGGASVVTDVVMKIGAKAPNSFDQFARDFAPTFGSSATAR